MPVRAVFTFDLQANLPGASQAVLAEAAREGRALNTLKPCKLPRPIPSRTVDHVAVVRTDFDADSAREIVFPVVRVRASRSGVRRRPGG